MKFVLSKTIGEEREIIDFLPTMVGWGRWENPEQKIECEYQLDREGNQTINEKGEVEIMVKETVKVAYKDGNNNLHHLLLREGTIWNVNPVLFIDNETERETAE